MSLLDRLLLANLESEMRVHRCCGLHHSDAEVQIASHLRLLEEVHNMVESRLDVDEDRMGGTGELDSVGSRWVDVVGAKNAHEKDPAGSGSPRRGGGGPVPPAEIVIFPGRFFGSGGLGHWVRSWTKNALFDIKAGWNKEKEVEISGDGSDEATGDNKTERTEETECVICFTKLAELKKRSYKGRSLLFSKWLRACPNQHLFCRACLDEHIRTQGRYDRNNATCPMCRVRLPALTESFRGIEVDAKADLRRRLLGGNPEFERLSKFFRSGHALRRRCWDPAVVPTVAAISGVLWDGNGPIKIFPTGF